MKYFLFVATFLCSFAANAANFSFTGNLASDSDHQRFTFTVDAESSVSIRTFGFAGGINSAGTEILAGGFDPIIALFDSTGDMLAWNDDCDPGSGANCDAFNEDSGDLYDSLLEYDVIAGDYTVALGYYDQDFSQWPSLNDIIWTGGFNFDGRSNHWALDISGEHVSAALLANPSQVPVPAAVWLFGSALLGLTGMKRKSA